VSHFLAGVKNLDYRALPLLMEIVSHLVYEFGSHNKVINLTFWATLRSVHSLRSLLHSTTLHQKCRL
ncbi:hypothetical protein, partial [Teredinibacter turnerae]|uniref:hypothetical protein n=1 Tax=Teredinibacter turnerae TaxID=2426 RepID=UPI001E3E0478